MIQLILLSLPVIMSFLLSALYSHVIHNLKLSFIEMSITLKFYKQFTCFQFLTKRNIQFFCLEKKSCTPQVYMKKEKKISWILDYNNDLEPAFLSIVPAFMYFCNSLYLRYPWSTAITPPQAPGLPETTPPTFWSGARHLEWQTTRCLKQSI